MRRREYVDAEMMHPRMWLTDGGVVSVLKVIIHDYFDRFRDMVKAVIVNNRDKYHK